MNDIQLFFLEQGAQTAANVATRIAEFIAGATRTIDMALYDLHLEGEARDIFVNALQERRKAGVVIRTCFDSGDDPRRNEPLNAGPISNQTGDFLNAAGLPGKPILSDVNLMHHKYIVLDAFTPGAKVLTGSANFTDDSWNLQENNVLLIDSPQLANFYTQDFNELWSTGSIATTGTLDTGHVTLSYKGQPAPTMVGFSPGEGSWIDSEITRRIARAEREITLAFVVLTSGHILGALGDALQDGLPINGVYDRTQMNGVLHQWRALPRSSWKIDAFESLVQGAHLAGKNSTPYQPGSTHDFMHNKIIIVDDLVITGSYNFSRNAQANAENILLIESPTLAADYRAYVRGLATRFGAKG